MFKIFLLVIQADKIIKRTHVTWKKVSINNGRSLVDIEPFYC